MAKQRDYALDALKILATITIIFHHYQQICDVQFERGINFFGGFFNFGYVVELFFIISGYVMFPYVKELLLGGVSFKEFYLKRFLRVFPVMTCGAIGYECFLTIYNRLCQAEGGSWFDQTPSLWGTVIASLGIQHGWGLSDLRVNYPTWYISVLLLCYIWMYLAVYISNRLKISYRYFFAFMIFIGISTLTYNFKLPLFQGETGRGYCAFFAGLFLADFLKESHQIKKWFLPSFATLSFLTMLIVKHSTLLGAEIWYILVFLYYPSLIIVFKLIFSTKLCSFKWIGMLSKISFSTYIWHNPFYILMYIFIKVFHWGLNLQSRKTMIGYAVFCYTFGALFYFLFEKPVALWIGKKFLKRENEKQQGVLS